jgi:hypothetical protein
MNKIVDDILEILQENELIQSTRVVNYDETPSGRLEAKLRSQLPKNHILQIWIISNQNRWIMPINCLPLSHSCAGTIPPTTATFPMPRIIFTMRTAKYPIRR